MWDPNRELSAQAIPKNSLPNSPKTIGKNYSNANHYYSTILNLVNSVGIINQFYLKQSRIYLCKVSKYFSINAKNAKSSVLRSMHILYKLESIYIINLICPHFLC